MWPTAGAEDRESLYFHPDTKCCTYIPDLPSFLVGRILDDGDPALAPGRATVEQRIDARVGVTPLGLHRPPVHLLLYQHGAQSGFGRAVSLRCPHYRTDTGGTCGIWRHRNGVCSTWYCKHTRGATGQRVWHALDQLLAIVERSLTRWCLLQLDLDGEALARLLPRGADREGEGTTIDAEGIDGIVAEGAYAALWGTWRGRERELYRRAAELVSALEWPDVVRIGGASVEAFARVVVHEQAALGETSLPRRLTVGPFQTVAVGRERVRVVTYSPYDPLELPRLLVDVLPYFDGRPTTQTLRQIRDERGLNIQPSLVRRLLDFGILVAPR
jgi:hypothetical protein